MHLSYTAALLIAPSVSFADSQITVPASDLAAKNYLNYEQREPCQYYKVMPQSLAGMDRCGSTEQPPVKIADGKFHLLPIVSTYTVYFDFDKSNIRQDQQVVINRLVDEINIHHPTQITVVGHTDTSGDATYNQALSAKRADSVSRALTALNIPNFYLDEKAVGEENLAVPTPDNTRLQENRRVVIQFRK